MKCLVVDPSPTMRRIITNILLTSGCDDVASFEDAEQAAQHIEDEGGGVDLVVTEWDLPESPGPEFVASLRRTADAESLPVIMISSRNTRQDVASAIEAGVNGYVLKPFNADTLTQKVTEFLSKKKRAAADAVSDDESTGEREPEDYEETADEEERRAA